MEKTKTSPLSFIKKWCYDKRLYFLVFFLPVAIMFSAYAFFKIHPIGDSSVLVLDLNGQYVYYYEQFRDAFHGNGSFIYNWSRNLSGEMFGVFAYYLASPFMLILVLLPRTMMATSILILQLAKIGTAAVTFMFFLKKISVQKPKTISLIIFPTMYALMSYMVVQLMDPMWLDGLIYLPLICWGVHRLVDEGKLAAFTSLTVQRNHSFRSSPSFNCQNPLRRSTAWRSLSVKQLPSLRMAGHVSSTR